LAPLTDLLLRIYGWTERQHAAQAWPGQPASLNRAPPLPFAPAHPLVPPRCRRRPGGAGVLPARRSAPALAPLTDLLLQIYGWTERQHAAQAWPGQPASLNRAPPLPFAPARFNRPLVPPRCRRRPGGAARASERARFGAAHRPPSSDLWLDGAAARCPGVAWPACIAQPRTTPPVSPRPLVPPRAARQRVCEARRHARARQEYSHEEVSHPLCAADGPPSLCGRVGSWRRGAQ
jgi:hypothetical protein